MSSQLNLFNNNLKRKGREVFLNNSLEPIIAIVRKSINLKQGIDEKHIYTPIETDVFQGDIVTFDGNKYLIINKEYPTTKIYTKCMIRKIHQSINIKFANTDVWVIDCFIADNIQTIKTGAIIDVSTGSIVVTVPLNYKTKHIREETRFFAMGKRVWEVIGVTSTDEGLIKLYCEKTQIIDSDDKEVEIAYNSFSVDVEEPVEPEPITYAVTFTETNSIDLTNAITVRNSEDELQQDLNNLLSGNYTYSIRLTGYEDVAGEFTIEDGDINIDVTLVGVVVPPTYYEVTFTETNNVDLTNATITVNGVTDLTQVENGTYTYTITLDDYEELTGSFTVEDANVNVDVTLVEVATEPDDYNLEIEGEGIVYPGFDEVYTAKLTNNGVPVTDKEVTWELMNGDFTFSPEYATVLSTDGMDVTIMPIDSTRYIGKIIVIMCDCVELDLYAEREVTIRGFF